MEGLLLPSLPQVQYMLLVIIYLHLIIYGGQVLLDFGLAI
ncbi:hypothetical protein XBKQ1_1540002 [Xenorhabdus bovienii str. kraussei Quebec]|uniref:Uncharacterized protein n=1 Tax=Xenorhabdus bovienii str. kraussei Quebec TaxID=1398203 RepID=A0A077PCI6_XENBV|nr:hypothetical protein XBKQ1_1540002 [Xenorhabdus bovienii str. kraussei Quebec]